MRYSEFVVCVLVSLACTRALPINSVGDGQAFGHEDQVSTRRHILTNDTASPSINPTPVPSVDPTTPSSPPTLVPTPVPSSRPTAYPTSTPTPHPTPSPTLTPTPFPTQIPTSLPTGLPRILSISPRVLSTTGGTIVTITGADLGSSSRADLSVTYGATGVEYSATSCSVVTEDTVIECTSAAGAGANHSWIIDYNGVATSSLLSCGSDPQTCTSYTAPVVDSLRAPNYLDTDGGQYVILNGSSFGPDGTSVYATYEKLNANGVDLAHSTYTTSACSFIVEQTSVQCPTESGVGTDHYWTLVVEDQSSNTLLTTSTSYHKPVISTLSPTEIDTTGVDFVTITGSYFGPVVTSNSITASYQNPNLQNLAGSMYNVSCTLSSTTQLVCATSEGVGYDQYWRITVGGQKSAASTTATTYTPPSVSSSSPSSLETSGSETITIIGSNFGPSSSLNHVEMTYTNSGQSGLAGSIFVATSCVVKSDRKMTCTSAEGVGAELAITVVVGNQTTVSSETLRYTTPDVTSVSTPSGSLDTEGHSVVTIIGTNFGPVDTENEVSASYASIYRVASSPFLYDQRFDMVKCNVTTAHTTMECFSVAGVGGSMSFQTTVGYQKSSNSTSLLSYTQPTITSVTGTTELKTSGGEHFTVTGTSFGPAPSSGCQSDSTCNNATVQYGRANPRLLFEALNCRVTVSHVQIVCQSSQGVGKDLIVRAEIGHQLSVREPSQNVSYIAPAITSIYPTAGGAVGGEHITVSGTNFGSSDINGSAVAIIGGVESDILSRDHTKIVFEVPALDAGTHSVYVYVGGQISDQSTDASYAAYIADRTIPAAGPVRGGTTVYITGSGFRDTPTIYLRADGTNGLDFLEPTFIDNKTLSFVAPVFTDYPSWFGVEVPLYLTLNNISWSELNTGFTPYLPANFSKFTPASGPVSGSSFVITGSGFADSGVAYARIAAHSTYDRVLKTIPSSAINREDLIPCRVVDSTTMNCTVPNSGFDFNFSWSEHSEPVNRTTEIVNISVTMDNPDYNDNCDFSGSTLDYYFYEDPQLFPTNVSTPFIQRFAAVLVGVPRAELSFEDLRVFENFTLWSAHRSLSAGSSINPTSAKIESLIDLTESDASKTSIIIQIHTASHHSTTFVESELGSSFLGSVSDIQQLGGGFVSAVSLTRITLNADPVVTPQRGPTQTVDGLGTRVTISGFGIVPTFDGLVVRLKDTYIYNDTSGSPLEVIVGPDNSSTSISIYAPDVNTTGKVVDIEVALNGQDFSSSGVAFTYFYLGEMFQTYSLSGSVYGPEHSETYLELLGDGFISADYVSSDPYNLSSYSPHDSELISLNFTANSTAEVTNYDLKATYLDSKTIRVTLPSGISTGVYTIDWKIGPSWASAVTGPSFYTVYTTPTVTSLHPRTGPLRGGTLITINGEFFETGYVDARLNGTSAKLHSCSQPSSFSLVCNTPRHDGGGDALTLAITTDTPDVLNPKFHLLPDYSFLYYSNLSLTTVSPTFGLASGGTLITLAGDGLEFLDTGAGYVSGVKGQIGSQVNSSDVYSYRPRYMVEVTVVNHDEVNHTNAATSLSLNTKHLISQGLVNPDCSDIRVFYETESEDTLNSPRFFGTLDFAMSRPFGRYLNHYVEGCGSSDSTLWMNLDTLGRNGTSNLPLVVLFGGNMSTSALGEYEFWATTDEDPDDVFLFYDDFDNKDPSKWDFVRFVEDYNSVNFSYSDGSIAFFADPNNNVSDSVDHILMHTSSPVVDLESTTVLSADVTLVNATDCQSSFAMGVGLYSSPFELLDVRATYCILSSDWSVKKCLNDECVTCPLSSTSRSISPELWIYQGDSWTLPTLQLVDTTCPPVSTSSHSFVQVNSTLQPLYAFVGSINASSNPHVDNLQVDTFRVYKSGNISSTQINGTDIPGGLSLASRRLVMLTSSSNVPVGSLHDIGITFNGQQYEATTTSDAFYVEDLKGTGSVLVLDPTISTDVVSAVGDEVVYIQGVINSSSTPSGVTIRYSDSTQTQYAKGYLTQDDGNITTIAPDWSSYGVLDVPSNVTSLFVSLNDQQFVSVGSISVDLPDLCPVLDDDFDYIVSASPDASYQDFGIHRWNWKKIVGGNLTTSCSDNSVPSLYQYQRLSFRESGPRYLESTTFDATHILGARDMSVVGNLSFVLNFPDGYSGTSCKSRTNPLNRPVKLQFSTSGGTGWTTLVSFFMDDNYEHASWLRQDPITYDETSGRYTLNFDGMIELASKVLSLRWYQGDHVADGEEVWAIDSVRLLLIPATQPVIEIDDIQPRGSLVSGGTAVTITGTFPDVSVPLTCRFHYGGDMTGTGYNSRYESWNYLGIPSMNVTRINNTAIVCTSPPYYLDIDSTSRCSSDYQKLCTDCCLMRVSVHACGVSNTFTSVDTYSDTASAPSEYLLNPREFMYYLDLTVTGLFPLTATFSEDGTVVQLTESGSSIFYSNSIYVRFTIGSCDPMLFSATVNSGFGLLTDYPQIGTNYDEPGFPLSGDSNSYRFQAMYLWNELESLYDEAVAVQGLSETALASLCDTAGYFESLGLSDTCDDVWDSYSDYIGTIDRIQFKVSTAPTKNFYNLRISIDQAIPDSNDDLYDLVGGLEIFYSSVESDDSSTVILSVDGEYDVASGTTHGWADQASPLEDESWVTLYLDNPFELSELDHLLIEIAEDGKDYDPRYTSPADATLYYQHVYDRRTIRWYTSQQPTSNYPFDDDIPTSSPYTNMTFGQRVPMIQFCIFPKACPSQAVLEVSTSTTSYDSSCADDGDEDEYWTSASVEVTLNGQDWDSVNDIYLYVYDESYLYFDAETLAPLIGPTTGLTETQFPVDSTTFPIYDATEYLAYLEDNTLDSPTDQIVARWKLQGSNYQEFARGVITTDNSPEYIYAFTPTLRAGTYDVSLSVNGRTFWPSSTTYVRSDNCTIDTTVRTLGGDCVSSSSECIGTFLSGGFTATNPELTCDYCCITETEFLIYEDFDITYTDGSSAWEGYSSGYDPYSTDTLLTMEIDVDFGSADYVDEDRICCFWYAPRSASGTVLEDDSDYDDRILTVATSISEIPSELPSETTYSICGSTYASLDSTATVLTCSPPPLPVWDDSDYVWNVRVTVNAQNTHGDSTNAVEYEGLEYYPQACPQGYFAATYEDVCVACAAGKYDKRTGSQIIYYDATYTSCTYCPKGKYQADTGSSSCDNCPRGNNEVESNHFATTVDLDGDVVTGQISRDACSCKKGYYRDPTLDCDTTYECCSACPTGATCDGGVSDQKPMSFDRQSGDLSWMRAQYYDVTSQNQSAKVYQLMPYADRGYYRVTGSTEGVMEECVPKPATDDDGSDPGACEGGVYDSTSDIQYDNSCSLGYDGVQCSECATDYYKDNFVCKACPPKNFYLLGFFFLCVVAFLGFFAKYARHLNGLASPRVVYNFIIVNSTFFYFDISWPPEISDFLEFIDTYLAISVDIIHSECEIDLTFLQKTYLYLSLPIVLGEIFAFLYVLELFFRKFQLENEKAFDRTETAANRYLAIRRGVKVMVKDGCLEIFRQFFYNLFLSLVGGRGLLVTVFFFLVSPATITVYFLVTAFIRRFSSLNPATVTTIVDGRLHSLEESTARLFEFFVWFMTYVCGGIPALLFGTPLYILFVLYHKLQAWLDLSALGSRLDAERASPKYQTFFSHMLESTRNWFLRWFIVFPVVFVFVTPIDLFATTLSYLSKVMSYLFFPPIPVPLSQWEIHAGKASAMVWFPDRLYDSQGEPGTFGSRLIHTISGHIALALFFPVCVLFSLLGRIWEGVAWMNAPGAGRTIRQPRTPFIEWRKQAIAYWEGMHRQLGMQRPESRRIMTSAEEQAKHAVPYGYIRVRLGQSWVGQIINISRRLTRKDEVRQVVAIDPTRASQPDRIHIEEPLVDYPTQKQRFMYMSREAIDAAIEQRLGKPRWDLSIFDIIQAIEQEEGEFFVRRMRKVEILEQLREIANSDLQSRPTHASQEGDQEPMELDAETAAPAPSLAAEQDYDESNVTSSVKFVEMKTLVDGTTSDAAPTAHSTGSSKPPPKRSVSSKRSVRAVQNTIQEMALDMVGLLHGQWVLGAGTLTAENSEELTVLTGDMDRSRYNWSKIRGTAFKHLCSCCCNIKELYDVIKGRGAYEGFAVEARLAFLLVLTGLSLIYPVVFVALIVVSLVAPFILPSLGSGSSHGMRAEIILRVEKSRISGSALANASIAATKRRNLTEAQRERARERWHWAFRRVADLNKFSQHYADPRQRRKSRIIAEDKALIIQARQLGILDRENLQTHSMVNVNAPKTVTSALKNVKVMGIDPRDGAFETWLRRTGVTVFAKRATRRRHEYDKTGLETLKSQVWDGAVRFDVDMTTGKYKNSDAMGKKLTEEELMFASRYQDSAVSIRFENRSSGHSQLPEFVAVIFFSDPETAQVWKRAVEMEADNPNTMIKGFRMAWRRSIVGHVFNLFLEAIFYIVLTPVVFSITAIFQFFRQLSFIYRYFEKKIRALVGTIFSVVLFIITRRPVSQAKKKANKGANPPKKGRPIIHDAMDRPTFRDHWLRDLDSVNDEAALQAVEATDSSRYGSHFFVDRQLQHGLTTYITTFPERNAELRVFRYISNQLNDFAENHGELSTTTFSPRAIANKYVNAFVMLMSFSHVTLSLRLFELVDCTYQDTSQRWTLDVDKRYECYSGLWSSGTSSSLTETSKHLELLKIFWIAGPLYIIGIPLAIESIIYFSVIRPGLRHESFAKTRYGYIYAKYNPDAWWWETVFMFRKLAVPTWNMFTSAFDPVIQVSGAFLLFLSLTVWQNLVQPFIEEGCNTCDAFALNAHIFVMFAGAMYLTGRLVDTLSSLYAYVFILVNTGVFIYIAHYALIEVSESLPLFGMLIKSEFWIDKAWPYVRATVNYRLFGGKYKSEYVRSSEEFFAYYHFHDEEDYRTAMAEKLRRQPILSDAGRAKAKEWIKDHSSTMRDGLVYSRYLNRCKSEINRSVFVYMMTSEKYFHTNQFEYARYDKWLSSFAASMRVMKTHYSDDMRLLRHYGIGKGIGGYLEYTKFVTLASVDVEKLLETHLPQESDRKKRKHRTHDTETRPYVDLDGSGNYYLCFINRVVSVNEIHVSVCESKAPPHLVPDPNDPDKVPKHPIILPRPDKDIKVSIKRIRIYSRVSIKDLNGDQWPGEITRAMPDGTFLVRDPIHGDYNYPLARGDIQRLGPAFDHPIGYIWHSFGEEEDQKELTELRREDLEIYLYTTETLAVEKVPCKTQIEWLQSRMVLSPVAVGGRTYDGTSTWTAAGYADGTVDVWNYWTGYKMFSLFHGDPVIFTYIAPQGNVAVTVSRKYLVYWELPRDRDMNPPARLSNREPYASRFYQEDTMASQPYDQEERALSEFILPEEFHDAQILAIGDATYTVDQTTIWIVAASEKFVMLWGCSQRGHLYHAQSWPQPTDMMTGRIVSAQIMTPWRKPSSPVSPDAIYGPEKSKDTQMIVLSTDRGNFFAVHAMGFPTRHVKPPPARRRTSIWGRSSASASKSLFSGTRLSAADRPTREIVPLRATVMHHLPPEKERETRAKNMERLEGEITEIWKAYTKHEKGLEHSESFRTNIADRVGQEIKALKKKIFTLPAGMDKNRLQDMVDILSKKKDYLERYDVRFEVAESYVCPETMRIVLLLKAESMAKRSKAERVRWFMRAVEIRRDPNASPHDGAPPLILVKIDDSCDLTDMWPRTDPGFFDSAAAHYLSRLVSGSKDLYHPSSSRATASTEKERQRAKRGIINPQLTTDRYNGSFEYMSSKKWFEDTLDLGFDHMVEEARHRRLMEAGSSRWSFSPGQSAGGGSGRNFAKGSSTFGYRGSLTNVFLSPDEHGSNYKLSFLLPGDSESEMVYTGGDAEEDDGFFAAVDEVVRQHRGTVDDDDDAVDNIDLDQLEAQSPRSLFGVLSNQIRGAGFGLFPSSQGPTLYSASGGQQTGGLVPIKLALTIRENITFLVDPSGGKQTSLRGSVFVETSVPESSGYVLQQKRLEFENTENELNPFIDDIFGLSMLRLPAALTFQFHQPEVNLEVETSVPFPGGRVSGDEGDEDSRILTVNIAPPVFTPSDGRLAKYKNVPSLAYSIPGQSTPPEQFLRVDCMVIFEEESKLIMIELSLTAAQDLNKMDIAIQLPRIHTACSYSSVVNGVPQAHIQDCLVDPNTKEVIWRGCMVEAGEKFKGKVNLKVSGSSPFGQGDGGGATLRLSASHQHPIRSPAASVKIKDQGLSVVSVEYRAPTYEYTMEYHSIPTFFIKPSKKVAAPPQPAAPLLKNVKFPSMSKKLFPAASSTPPRDSAEHHIELMGTANPPSEGFSGSNDSPSTTTTPHDPPPNLPKVKQPAAAVNVTKSAAASELEREDESDEEITMPVKETTTPKKKKKSLLGFGSSKSNDEGDDQEGGGIFDFFKTEKKKEKQEKEGGEGAFGDLFTGLFSG